MSIKWACNRFMGFNLKLLDSRNCKSRCRVKGREDLNDLEKWIVIGLVLSV